MGRPIRFGSPRSVDGQNSDDHYAYEVHQIWRKSTTDSNAMIVTRNKESETKSLHGAEIFSYNRTRMRLLEIVGDPGRTIDWSEI